MGPGDKHSIKTNVTPQPHPAFRPGQRRALGYVGALFSAFVFYVMVARIAPGPHTFGIWLDIWSFRVASFIALCLFVEMFISPQQPSRILQRGMGLVRRLKRNSARRDRHNS